MSHTSGARALHRPARRRSPLFGISVILVVLLGIYAAYALLRAVPDATATPEPVSRSLTTAVTPLAWPGTPAVAAVGAVGFDGVLASSGSQARTPIASMTKTITALVVLDAKPLAQGEDGPDYTFTELDAKIYEDTVREGGSRAPVVVGATVTERQLLEGLMLPSGNNYAITLATWAYGSMDKFLDAARVWLDKNGLTDTVLADASGINPGSQSSPPNLIEIGKLALAHPVLSAVVGEKVVNIPGVGEVKNTNSLLGTDGIIGLKTGTTIVAGACLLFAAEQKIDDKTVTVVGVVIGAEDHKSLFSAVPTLLGTVKDALHRVTLVESGDVIARVDTAWGARANVVATQTERVLTWQDSWVDREVALEVPNSGRGGEAAGHVTFTEDGKKTVVPVVLGEKLAGPSAWWRLTHPW